MNCHNGAAYLREAIASVRSQTVADWEIIFWDDASTDGSGDLAQGFHDSRIRYFRTPVKIPLGQARTHAFAAARGEFLAMLDVDDRWMPEKSARQLSCFEANTGVTLAHCDTRVFDDQGLSFRVFGQRPPVGGQVFGDLLRLYYLFTVSVMVRRAGLGDPPWFEPTLDMCHDKALFLRAAYAGEVGYVPEVLAEYRMHGSSWSQTRHDLLAAEDLRILQSWRERVPDFDVSYGEQIREYQAGIDWRMALSLWRLGEAAQARQKLRRHWGRHRRATLLHALTFLPPALWLPLQKFYYKRMRTLIPPRRRPQDVKS